MHQEAEKKKLRMQQTQQRERQRQQQQEKEREEEEARRAAQLAAERELNAQVWQSVGWVFGLLAEASSSGEVGTEAIPARETRRFRDHPELSLSTPMQNRNKNIPIKSFSLLSLCLPRSHQHTRFIVGLFALRSRV
jgi:hypothetical protein